MAKFHLDRIRQKYGWTGGKYQALMAAIIEHQSDAIARRMAEIKKGKLDRLAKEALARAGKKVAVPDISEVLPARSVWVRKGAERGKLLTDSLRDQLTSGLRSAVLDWIKEGKPTMQYRRGAKAGRMSPELVQRFEQHVAQVFAGYAKRDPELGGVPRNVKTIADTEVRSVTSAIKHGYVVLTAGRNPDLGAMKTWVHHPELSKDPRPGHAAVSGKRVALDQAFSVPVYERVGTIRSGPNKGRPRWRRTRETVSMVHPHDPSAPIGEVASCHCELDYVWDVAKSGGAA